MKVESMEPKILERESGKSKKTKEKHKLGKNEPKPARKCSKYGTCG